jgi:hypothetical protein
MDIYIGLLFTFAVVFGVMYTALNTQKHNQQRNTKTEEKTNQKKQGFTQDEYEQMLMTLFSYNVISQQEYNRLLVNGLPYFK